VGGGAEAVEEAGEGVVEVVVKCSNNLKRKPVGCGDSRLLLWTDDCMKGSIPSAILQSIAWIYICGHHEDDDICDYGHSEDANIPCLNNKY
jgi:hypothetical protein